MKTSFQLIKRLYLDYSKNYIWKIVLSGFFSIIVAGATSGIAYLLDPSIFSGKLVNVIVEEDSELTRGETVVDWLGVTNRKPNCFVMDKADDKKFFQLLKNKLATLP